MSQVKSWSFYNCFDLGYDGAATKRVDIFIHPHDCNYRDFPVLRKSSAMSRFWSPVLESLSPYVPGEQRNGTGVIKLNTNENPYPPSKSVMQAIASVEGSQLRRYPHPQSAALVDELANYHQLEPNQVFVGNGSDEVLAHAFMAFFTQPQPLVFPAITYSFYPVYCQLYNIPFIELPMAENFAIDWQAIPENVGGIAFPNPNAPTGIACDLSTIEKLLADHPTTVVLVDEAYIDFGASSAVALIQRYPNLLVTHTFSKGRSLAGLRIGAAYGNAELIDGLRRVKDSFNSYPLDVVAQAAALASLNDEAYHRLHINKIVANRDWLTQQLTDRGFSVLPSAANFIFASPTQVNAKQLHEYLNDRDILVRYWDKPLLKDWLRISIGTPEELQKLVDAIDVAQNLSSTRAH